MSVPASPIRILPVPPYQYLRPDLIAGRLSSSDVRSLVSRMAISLALGPTNPNLDEMVCLQEAAFLRAEQLTLGRYSAIGERSAEFDNYFHLSRLVPAS